MGKYQHLMVLPWLVMAKRLLLPKVLLVILPLVIQRILALLRLRNPKVLRMVSPMKLLKNLFTKQR